MDFARRETLGQMVYPVRIEIPEGPETLMLTVEQIREGIAAEA